jgi:hypothetical protein
MYTLAVVMLIANTGGVAASAVFVQQSGKVFTVYPTGKDDTHNIQQAFDKAVKAGPGSTVKLVAGNFKTRFIEVWNFDGTFMGAGQKATVIDTFADQDCQALVDRSRIPVIFNFFRGNVRVSDLGFHITPTNPCAPYHFGELDGYADGHFMATYLDVLNISSAPFDPMTDCYAIRKEKVSAAITRISVKGEQGTPQNGENVPFYSNLGEPILLGGSYTPNNLWVTQPDCIFLGNYAQGTFSLTNSSIQNASIAAVDFELMYNSSALIRGNSIDTVTNGICMEENSGTKLDIANNQVKNVWWGGIYVAQGDESTQPMIETPSVYDIHDNEVKGVAGGGYSGPSIVAMDSDHLNFPDAGKNAILSIHNNSINLDSSHAQDPDSVVGVRLEWVDDSLVANNKVSGSGGAAIVGGQWGGTSKRDLILGNDLTRFTPINNSPYKIILGESTQKYVVVGEPVANVADFGTDNLVAGTHFQTPHSAGVDALKLVWGMLKHHPHSGQH